MLKNIRLLDCTLRDGGFGLEDIYKTNPSELGFADHSQLVVRDKLAKAGIDIVELGTAEVTETDMSRFCIYPDINTVCRNMPGKVIESQFYTTFYRGPDIPLSEIPEWNPNLSEAIRVIIRYSEQEKSLNFCAGLAEKGYKVFIQPMLTMRYSEDELQRIFYYANQMGAYAVYFVDSYGYMTSEDIDHLFEIYDKKLNPEINVGFHSHNNMNLAYSNVLSFLNRESERSVIIDSCIMGMGQGAGNVQTELLIPYLNERLKRGYDFDAVLDACDEIEKYTPVGKWGYSVTRLLPALHKTAYKYSLALRNQYGFGFSKINYILKNMPDELRHRYTPENTREVLKILNIPV